MEAIQEFISGHQIIALAIVFGIMALGEYVSYLCKSWVPSGVVMMIVFILGFWTILPSTLASDAGIVPQVYVLSVLLLITHLGTLIDRKQMAAQWQTVVIALMGLVGIIVACTTVGSWIFGRDNAIVACPVLCGGAIAVGIMQDAATAAGNDQAALVAIVTFVMQGLFGMPITALCLKKEVARQRQFYKEGTLKAPESKKTAATGETKKIKFGSATWILFKLALVAVCGYLLQVLCEAIVGPNNTQYAISQYVWCLLLGFLATEIGFLPRNALHVANADGILITFLLGYLFCSFSMATPELIAPVLGIVLGLAVISTLFLALVAYIASKIFKNETFWTCMAIVCEAYLGFPLNVQLVGDALRFIEDPDEKAAVESQIQPKLVIAGFVCVTIVSVFVAGILANFV
ncbi:MAG: hypothetical protein ACOX6J_02760 [Oscillospiraceae bacterium]|jgi:hypothetical protein